MKVHVLAIILLLASAFPAISGDRPPEEAFSADRMLETVRFLASEELGGRGLGTPELDRAAEYIAGKFRGAGLRPGGDNGGWFRSWKDPELGIAMKNVVGYLPGRDAGLAGQSAVIGAHYDHLGTGGTGIQKENRGKIHPGADDNASGVAVLLELARLLGAAAQPDRSIVFIAFTGEEAGRKGSLQYVRSERQFPASRAIAMINIDTVGRMGKGGLIVLNAGSAKEWPRIFQEAGKAAGTAVEVNVALLDASDQVSFHLAGVPAVQLFTGAHPDYHRPTDTWDKVDADGLAKVAAVAKEAVQHLASRKDPLTSVLTGSRQDAAPKQERKVSLGTIPDFAFTGPGVRLSGVVPGSPAEAAGMRKGDVIIRLNAWAVNGLQDLSDALKTMKAGDRVTVVFLREGQEMKVEAEVKER